MNEEPLIISLTIHLCDDEESAPYTSISSVFDEAEPTSLTSWDIGSSQKVATQTGAAIGCQDGSIYLLRAHLHSPLPSVSEPPDTPTSPRSPSVKSFVLSPSAKLVHSPKPSGRPTPFHSRPASPVPSFRSSAKSVLFSASTAGPAPINPKGARVGSAVSKAQAQAPTNYVDFDKEEQKLRDMLDRQHIVKDKTVVDQVFEVMGRPIRDVDKHTLEQVEVLVKDVAPTSSEVPSTEKPSSPALSPVIMLSPSTPSPLPSPSLNRSAASPTPWPTKTPPMHRSPQTPLPSSPTSPQGETRIGPSFALSHHIFPCGIQTAAYISALLTLMTPYFVSLSSAGDVNVLSIVDGRSEANLSVTVDTTKDTAKRVWEWQAMEKARISEADVLLIRASEIVLEEREKGPGSRVVAIRINVSADQSIRLEKVGDWVFNACFSSIGSSILEDSTPIVYLVDESGDLVFHRIIPYRAPMTTAPTSANVSTTHLPLSLPIIIPNPFKMRTPHRSVEALNEELIITNKLTLDEGFNICKIGEIGQSVHGLRIWNGVRGAIWNEGEIEFFRIIGLGSEDHRRVSISMVSDVTWTEGDVFVVHKKGVVQVISISEPEETLPKGSVANSSNRSRFKVLRSTPVVLTPLWTRSQSAVLLCLWRTPQFIKMSTLSSLPDTVEESSLWEHELPEASATFSSSPKLRVTALLPFDLDIIVLGYSDGRVGRNSLAELLCDHDQGNAKRRSEGSLAGYINSLHLLRRDGMDLLVGGADDGSVGVWNLRNLVLAGRWVMFATPLVHAALVDGGNYAGMQSAIVCVSEDGTVGVVQGNGDFQFMFLIPGSSAPLYKACLSEDNLVFMYEDYRARLWDVKTREFWRLMDVEKAEEIVRQGGWFIMDLRQGSQLKSPSPLHVPFTRWISSDKGVTLLLDIRQLDAATSKPNAPPDKHMSGQGRLHDGMEELPLDEVEKSARLPKQLHVIRPLLCSLLTYGLDFSVDAVCLNDLGLPPRRIPVSCGSPGVSSSFSIPATTDPHATWQISSTVTTFRLLALITILRVCLSYDEFEKQAAAIIAFYVASLPEAVSSYQPPSLPLLTRYWYDSSADIQQAARTLFMSVCSSMGHEEVIHIAEEWQRQLPSLQPDVDKESSTSARALVITGYVAVEKYALLSAGTLRDISQSISLYLNAEGTNNSILAIELCSRGFHIWQHYLDAVDTLRSLFHRATNMRKDAQPGVGAQARLAILQIASTSTPLFMTTLSLDILNAKTPEQHKSIMLLVAFIVRKKPLLLYHSLPRLVEAVVKTLDPNSSSREAVLNAATVILQQLVMTYPTIAFHNATQRLAVGTSEGAVIMYDLKTATRLYVLEGHRKRLAACSFSPDGRRLVTASLEESVVMVWKVGSSFSNLFHPGGPPRQGHAGSDPYKTFNFNIGDEGHMTIASTLEWITFEWPGERSARLKIRDSTFTFNT